MNSQNQHETSRNSSSTILMVRPANFGSNIETLADNAFQAPNNSQSQNQTCEKIHQKALQQFNQYAECLSGNNIQVIIVQDTKQPIKTDAIFPNNWFTAHANGTVIIYPMKSPIRRAQKTNPVLATLKKLNYKIETIVDLSFYQNQEYSDEKGENKIGRFLQGTGSMVLDHQNKIAYACKSQRTNKSLFIKYCTDILKYTPIIFQACDKNNILYYHTNVIMSVCSNFIIICTQSVKNKEQRQFLLKTLKQSESSISHMKKQIIQITIEQVNNFCGNVLQVCNRNGDLILTMSQTAFHSYNKQQLQIISRYCKKIVTCDIPTIQKYGGGGSRCMMTQIFLPKQQ